MVKVVCLGLLVENLSVLACGLFEVKLGGGVLEVRFSHVYCQHANTHVYVNARVISAPQR